MVKLGELNTRMKDFFDIWTLSHSQAFRGSALRDAIASTFAHRSTPLTADAIVFTAKFGASPDKHKQWTAFLNRSHLTDAAPDQFRIVWDDVMEFLSPMTLDDATDRSWQPGGPWHNTETRTS